MEQLEFDEAIKELFDWQKEHAEAFEAQQQERLKELWKSGQEPMRVSSYLRIMYLAGINYERQENKNAARYCAMRMLWMKECQVQKRKRRPLRMDMQDYAMDAEMEEFIERYTSFLDGIYRSINQKVLLLTAGLFFIVFLLLVFFLQIPLLLAAVEAILLGIINYVFQRRRMPDMFQKNQTRAIEQYVDEELLQFDFPYRC